MNETEAYKRGMGDYIDEVARTSEDCPYDAGSEKADDWQRGLNQAITESL